MNRFWILVLAVLLVAAALPARAGDVKDSSYRTVGYVKDNGTVQDSAYRTIGHASDLPRSWAAYYFFFSETLH